MAETKAVVGGVYRYPSNGAYCKVVKITDSRLFKTDAAKELSTALKEKQSKWECHLDGKSLGSDRTCDLDLSHNYAEPIKTVQPIDIWAI